MENFPKNIEEDAKELLRVEPIRYSQLKNVKDILAIGERFGSEQTSYHPYYKHKLNDFLTFFENPWIEFVNYIGTPKSSKGSWKSKLPKDKKRDLCSKFCLNIQQIEDRTKIKSLVNLNGLRNLDQKLKEKINQNIFSRNIKEIKGILEEMGYKIREMGEEYKNTNIQETDELVKAHSESEIEKNTQYEITPESHPLNLTLHPNTLIIPIHKSSNLSGPYSRISEYLKHEEQK